jgi:retinol dehydrogenase-12
MTFKFENIKQLAEANRFSIFGLTALASFFYLTKKFYFNGGTYHDKRTKLNGKCVIITGANTGIGKETAIDLAARGARVILACRNVEKANQAASEIRAKTGNGNVVVESLDLSSFESIRQFSSKINAQEERIDILINNAG